MIRRYDCNAQKNIASGPRHRPRADCIDTASSWEAGRVARIQAQEFANPASHMECGVFFDLFA